MDGVFATVPVKIFTPHSAKDEFEFLGIALMAHLRALRFGHVFAGSDLANVPVLSLRFLGLLFLQSPDAYRNAAMGKAFEYAVVELFQRRKGCHYTLICDGIKLVNEKRRSSRVKVTTLGPIEDLICVRIAWGAADSGKLDDYYSFKIFHNANLSIGGALGHFIGLERTVDALFCNARPLSAAKSFAVLTSFKSNPAAFAPASIDRAVPIDLGVTIADEGHPEGVYWLESNEMVVVRLPLFVDTDRVIAWKKATDIVVMAMRNQNRSAFIKFAEGFFHLFGGIMLQNQALDYWVRFVGRHLESPVEIVLGEIERQLADKYNVDTLTVQHVGAAKEDAVLRAY